VLKFPLCHHIKTGFEENVLCSLSTGDVFFRHKSSRSVKSAFQVNVLVVTGFLMGGDGTLLTHLLYTFVISYLEREVLRIAKGEQHKMYRQK
jgi:hypothetical protein